MSSTQDPTETGIAVLSDVNTTLANASTWRVNGIALSENAVTMGGSKRRRIWPEETLREAAELLTDRPIVKNFHDLQGNATADDVIGRIESAGYQDGVGIVFEGEISDESIARKVGNDFLEVSAVPGIASESYDERQDAYVVEEISGFRDIAVVPDGADRGNEISIGERPAMAALSREALAQSWDVLQGADDDEEGSEDSDDEESDEAEIIAETVESPLAEGDESPEASTPPKSGLRAALERELELTGSTPDRCKTIKDGSKTLNLSSSQTARDALGIADDSGREMAMSGHEQASARAVLGFGGDDDDQSWTVRRTKRFDTDDSGEVDLEEDTLARQALAMGRDSDTADTLQDGRTPRTDDAVRWESDAGGEREPDERRYGVVVNALSDDDDDVVLVSVYEPTEDMDGWQNRTDDEERMSVENLEVVGSNGVDSLPPVSQVT